MAYGINPSLMKTQGQPMTFGLDNITGTNNINTNQNSFMQPNTGLFSGDNSIFSGIDTVEFDGSTMGITGESGSTQQGGFMDNFLMNEQGGAGFGLQALQAGTGLANTFLGFKNLSVAKDQLSFQKSAWQKQFDIQKEQYDRQVKERAQRVANNKASSAAAYSGG